MPARDTGCGAGRLVNNLPEVNLSESECSGKSGLLPLSNCKSPGEPSLSTELKRRISRKQCISKRQV